MTLLKRQFYLLVVYALLVLGGLPNAHAETSTGMRLVVKPSKCVSLRQGNTCYVDAEITWQSEKLGDYCLFERAQPAPLKCWSDQAQGTYLYAAATTTDLVFVITQAHEDSVLAQAQLTIAWVYEQKRNPVSWRLF